MALNLYKYHTDPTQLLYYDRVEFIEDKMFFRNDDGDIVVPGPLRLSYSDITRLPAGLKVGGKLDLTYSDITQLPAGLKVNGILDLEGTDITELPDGLKVSGGLNLYKTKITELPDDLEVGGLDIRNTPIFQLPDGLTVNGDVICGLIEKIGNNVTINGDLKNDDNSYRLQQDGFKSHFAMHERSSHPLSIGNNVTIKGKIDGDILKPVGGQYIVSIGDNFTVGDIDMSMRLKEIPKNFKKGGDPINWDKKDEYGWYKYR